ncbi:hypothetical protein [Leptothermofonsia sp. ETS-13]|uniref:hypothetical protein n=1 Tax=Leptothermofonsia sp. ETS-13 TaxID=3035696 RepID=UPI003B9E7A3E
MALQTTSIYSLVAEQEGAIAADWNPVCQITYNRDTWVKLLQRPSEYASDEAKLLCQDTPNTWIAWVPDYGEVVLGHGDFYC